MRARIAASIVLAVTIALGTSGCGFFAPQSTEKQYDASDGVSGNTGSIGVRNAMIISSAGKVGNLVTTFVNSDARSHRIEVQRQSGSHTLNQWVTVPANGSTSVGSPGQQLVLFPKLDVIVGSLYPVYFQYGAHTGVKLLVPVLDGQLPGYADLVPSKALIDKAKQG